MSGVCSPGIGCKPSFVYLSRMKANRIPSRRVLRELGHRHDCAGSCRRSRAVVGDVIRTASTFPPAGSSASSRIKSHEHLRRGLVRDAPIELRFAGKASSMRNRLDECPGRPRVRDRRARTVFFGLMISPSWFHPGVFGASSPFSEHPICRTRQRVFFGHLCVGHAHSHNAIRPTTTLQIVCHFVRDLSSHAQK